MPSARDLLQQADALMRSNRHVGVSGEELVPTLTDVAVPGAAGVSAEHSGAVSSSVHREWEEIPVLNHIIDVPETRFGRSARADTITRFSPTQTDASLLPLSQMPQIVDDDFAPARAADDVAPAAEPMQPGAEFPKWLEADLLDPVSAGDNLPPEAIAPDALAERTSREQWTERKEPTLRDEPLFRDEGSLRSEPTFQMDSAEEDVHPAPEAAPPPAMPVASAPPESEPPSAAETAETVYYQVLQNLDLYTERALQEHLTTHLAPIIEQATRELLATLNANLGALMRQYVAEAIEKQLGVRPDTEGRASTR